MTRSLWFVCSAIVLSLAIAGSAVAQDKKADAKAAPAAKAPDKPKTGLKGEYAIMANELKLDEAAAAKFIEKVKARDQAVAAWNKENADKLTAAKKAVDDAKKANDKDALKKAQTEMKALDDARAKVEDAGRAEILALLTPEQKTQWAGFNLYRGSIAGKYKRAELTDDQIVKVKALCVEAAKEIAALKPDDKQGLTAAREKLTKAVDGLLTADQKAKLAAPVAPKPAK